MFKTIALTLLLSLNLFSLTLDDTYFVHSNNIKLQDIVPDAKYNITLYQIEKNRYSKKVKTKTLLKLLSTHGFTSIEPTSRYVKFIKKSPIDISNIKNTILNAYKEIYSNSITMNSIRIIPRGYIKSLPDKYETRMPKKYFLSHKGTLSIKTLENKKIFFDYLIDAKLMVYLTRNTIKKSNRISTLNTLKKTIQLGKLKGLPISTAHLNISQAKRNLKVNTILTDRDIQTLNLVKKDSNVVVNLNNNNINISFSAKALQSGRLHDIITVQKSNRERLKVQVIGKNQVMIK